MGSGVLGLIARVSDFTAANWDCKGASIWEISVGLVPDSHSCVVGAMRGEISGRRSDYPVPGGNGARRGPTFRMSRQTVFWQAGLVLAVRILRSATHPAILSKMNDMREPGGAFPWLARMLLGWHQEEQRL